MVAVAATRICRYVGRSSMHSLTRSPSSPIHRSEPAGIPDNYVDGHVLQVVERDEGGALLLLDESSQLVLPIFIGGTEAASISLRLRGVPPQRPLTHDLLDTIVKKLHAQ